jgi:hypothetical protein
MDARTYWLLTDRNGWMTGRGTGLTWKAGVTHTMAESGPIAGYCCTSPHVPFLMDPFFEGYGRRARLWRSQAEGAKHQKLYRVQAMQWTASEEHPRPEWVGSAADLRVRLRFALGVASSLVRDADVRSALKSLALEDLGEAATLADRLRLNGGLSLAVRSAVRAVESAAKWGQEDTLGPDGTDRGYPLFTWYAAATAASACVALSAAAEEAVRRETPETVRLPMRLLPERPVWRRRPA